MPEEMNNDGVTNDEDLVEENNGDRVVSEIEGKNGDRVTDGEGGEDVLGGEENGEDLMPGEEEDQEKEEEPEEEEEDEDGDGDGDAEEDKKSEEVAEGEKKSEDVEKGKKSEEDEMITKESEEDAREGKMNEHNVEEVIEKKEGAEQENANNMKSNENSEKKVDENSTIVKKSRKRNRKKKVTLRQGVLNKVLSNDGNNPESSEKKKVLQKVESKDEDKPESSGKKKKSKKVESMGMIFMCTSQTKKDCYHYKLLGLPAGKKDIVEKIYKGMRLFLFDLDLRLMYGIYKAAGPGGSNIEPKAFKSAFPSQVRFTVMEDCLPLAEEKFKKVIKDNYYSRNKFHCELNSEQVKNLCKLFVSTSKASAKSLVVGRTSESRSKSMRQGRDDKRGLKQQDRRNEERGHKRPNRDEERGGRRPDRDEERGRKRRGRRQERSSPLRQEQRSLERPITYVNEVFSSQGAPLHRGYQLPAPSYVYERPLEVNPYRHEPLVDHRGLRLADQEPRYHDESKTLDPYVSYREIEAPLYRRPVYTLASEQREYYSPAVLPTAYVPREADRRTISGIQDYYQPESLPSEYLPVRREVDYRTTTDLPAEYHSARTLPLEYHGSRSLLAEYRAAGLPTEDLAQTRSAGYRRVGPATEYPSVGALRDYHSLRSTHRY